jgi:hypothetical protein
MQRRPITSYTLVAGTLVVVMGCSGGAEQKVLDDFFRASRLRDNTTLGNFATVAFDPRTDGSVQNFSVVSMSDERVRPIPLKQFAKQLADAKAAEEAFSAQKRAYQNANLAVIDRVTKAQAAGKAIAAKDKAVADAWAKWAGDAATHNKALSDAQRQLGANRGVAELSMARSRVAAADVTTLDGEMASKDIVINATVRQPDGTTTTKNLKAVVSRAKMKDERGQEVVGRWVVTAIGPA